MRITVALLTYNRSNYLNESLGAIISQTYRDIEILVMDNHSGDDTYGVVKDMVDKDDRVTYVRMPHNSSQIDNYCRAIEYSRGEYVLVTHDDDIMHPQYVKKIVETFKKDKSIGLFASNVELIDENGLGRGGCLYSMDADRYFKKDEYVVSYCREKLWLPTPTMCFKKELHYNFVYREPVSIGSGDSGMEYKPSGDIVFSVLSNTVMSVYLFAFPYLKYRQHDGQESRNVDQSVPMMQTMNELLGVYARKRRVKGFVENYFVKYSIQNVLFEHGLDALVVWLKKNKRYSKSTFYKLASALFGDAFQFVPSEGASDDSTDPYLEVLRSGELLFEKVAAFVADRKVVLVGSMLASYFMLAVLRRSGVYVSAVIDRSSQRIGRKVLDLEVCSYEDYFEQKYEEGSLFVITSERVSDTSIVDYVRRFAPVDIAFWQDMI